MTAPADVATAPREPDANIADILAGIGASARAAAQTLSLVETEVKNRALELAADRISAQATAILKANTHDLTEAGDRGISTAMLDRLALNGERISAISKGLRDVAALPDPVGDVMAEWKRPNGLHIQRVRTPLGVVGVIYESRPNVTADAGALCLKAGNAVILRGGSESFRSSRALYACLRDGIEAAGLPEGAIQMVPTRDRAAVGAMLTMPQYIDVIIPRGGRSLIERVQQDSRVPVFAHLEGICHVYIHSGADVDMALDIVINAKMRRTGVCGAAETLLIDRAVRDSHLPRIVDALAPAGCELRGDEAAREIDPRILPATEEDWHTEYLDAILAVRVVDGVDQAIQHINDFGSNHTDSIVTSEANAAAQFLAEVDSAIVLHNASTQYADGGEFGMGAEIGISTGRLHARGPVGVEQLTTYKYLVHGSGQVRP